MKFFRNSLLLRNQCGKYVVMCLQKNCLFICVLLDEERLNKKKMVVGQNNVNQQEESVYNLIPRTQVQAPKAPR